MSKKEFVEQHRHVLCGLVADGYTTQLRGAELAMNMRSAFKRVDALLELIFDELNMTKAPQNGAVTQGKK